MAGVDTLDDCVEAGPIGVSMADGSSLLPLSEEPLVVLDPDGLSIELVFVPDANGLPLALVVVFVLVLEEPVFPFEFPLEESVVEFPLEEPVFVLEDPEFEFELDGGEAKFLSVDQLMRNKMKGFAFKRTLPQCMHLKARYQNLSLSYSNCNMVSSGTPYSHNQSVYSRDIVKFRNTNLNASKLTVACVPACGTM
jgi:hypothetical protein